ncbi:MULTISPECIES: class I SAM-dependent methyltransferase [Herbaspirillum]|uniref:SAM-dependent methyltransferase n=1 Tax=Herbaspirillum rubrisubalbicans Os34 TaxID=1235827 RepID=A0A6M3ZXH8_9BURK|nr:MULTISPECIES: class I SAM-dependent methyltransferase [Herbaspirillum]QJQ03379.1 SAM-dependent methyltransferase [Herbaspirillum rubrisubalbicans Os34]
MAYIDFLSSVHKSTQRDYLARVNDPEFPKPKAAELAKQWGVDYWDGDRRICYGGYRYMPGRWAPVAQAMIDHYGLKAGDKVLDVGCGKGFLLYEMSLLVPGLEVHGIDISSYALENAKEEIRDRLQLGSATSLPFPDQYFDFVFSITTLHNLHNYDLDKALREMERVGKKKYVCVESYRNETEKANLLYWQVTCEAFCTPEEWDWWFRQTGYTGDHSLIYFE